MRRFSTMSGAAVILFALLIAGCGTANQFGGSVDMSTLCAFSQGTNSGSCQSNPSVSLAVDTPLYADISITNNMKYTTPSSSTTGQTVRIRKMDVEYSSPLAGIPKRVEQLTQNVDPGSTAKVPVSLVSYEQIEYMKSNAGLFSVFPSQINLHITISYDTTGGNSGEVERFFSVQVFE